MTNDIRKLGTILSLVIMLVGVLIAWFSYRHGHRHTGHNGVMLFVWGALLVVAINSVYNDFMFMIGCAIAIVGAGVWTHAAVYRHPHTKWDGIGMVVCGIILAAAALVADQPAKITQARRA